MSSNDTVKSASPPEQPLDEQLSRGACVEMLFREHNQSLVRFLAGRLSSDAEAKEVAQEAYVRLLQLDQPAATSLLRAILFKTATNIATDHLRRRRLAKAASVIETFDLNIDPRTPEAHVSSGEEVDIVSQCLNELSPRCRQAVLLSRIDGKQIGEIAVELGVSTRMIRRYISEALALIRDRLERARVK